MGVEYSAAQSLSVTALNSATQGQYVTSALLDNSQKGYHDIQIGGMFIVDATWAAGDTVDVYAAGVYSDTDTDIGGAFDDAGEITENATITEGTNFSVNNLKLLQSVTVAAATQLEAHWGPVLIAGRFGGVPPKKTILVFHINSADSGDDMVSGARCNYIGITYT